MTLAQTRMRPVIAAVIITSFRVRGGKADLLLEVPFGPPTIRQKQ